MPTTILPPKADAVVSKNDSAPNLRKRTPHTSPNDNQYELLSEQPGPVSSEAENNRGKAKAKTAQPSTSKPDFFDAEERPRTRGLPSRLGRVSSYHFGASLEEGMDTARAILSGQKVAFAEPKDGLLDENTIFAPSPLAADPAVTTPQPKEKETLFTWPPVFGENIASAISVAALTIGYGNLSNLATGAVAGLLSPTKTEAQWIVMAVQAGVALGTAAYSEIPWIQRHTGDSLISHISLKRWNEPLSSLPDEHPLKAAILGGMSQKYTLAAKQLSVAACSVGAGVFIGRPMAGWAAVSGSMAANLAFSIFLGEKIQKRMRGEAFEDTAVDVLKLVDRNASSTDREHARNFVDTMEIKTRKQWGSLEIGSLISFAFFGAGTAAGCLYAAGFIGGSASETKSDKQKELERHAKIAIPFVVGGLYRLATLPYEHKKTEITNIKMRAALAVRVSKAGQSVGKDRTETTKKK